MESEITFGFNCIKGMWETTDGKTFTSGSTNKASAEEMYSIALHRAVDPNRVKGISNIAAIAGNYDKLK